MRLLKQSSTAQPLMFLMIDSGDHVSAKTGLSPTVTLSKSGGSFASPSGAVTEVANGWYKVAGNATDTATLGPLILHATGSGADPCDEEFAVVAYDPQDAVHLGISALPNTACTTNASLLTSGSGTDQVLVASGKVVTPDTQKVDLNTIKTQTITCAAGVTIPTSLASPTNITAGTITTVTTVTNQLTAAQIATGVWQDAVSSDFTTASSIGKALYVSNVAPGAAGGHFIAGTNAQTTVTSGFGANSITATSIANNALAQAKFASDSQTMIATAGSVHAGVIGTVNSQTSFTLAAADALSDDTAVGQVIAIYDSTGTEFPPALRRIASQTYSSGSDSVTYTLSSAPAFTLTTGQIFRFYPSNFVPAAVSGAAGGLFIAGSNAATTLASFTITAAMTVNGTANVSQTGDSYARIGSTGSGLTSLALSSVWTPTIAGRIDVAISSVSGGGSSLDDIATAVITKQGTINALIETGSTTTAILIADADDNIAGGITGYEYLCSPTGLSPEHGHVTAVSGVGDDLRTITISPALSVTPVVGKTIQFFVPVGSVSNSVAQTGDSYAALTGAQAEPGQGAPAVNASPLTKIAHLFKSLRNRKTQTSSQYSLYADNGTTIDQKATVSNDGTTTTIGEIVSGP